MKLCQVIDFDKRKKFKKFSLSYNDQRVFYRPVCKLQTSDHISRSTRDIGTKLTLVIGLDNRR